MSALSSYRDILLPALWALTGRASSQRGSTVKETEISINVIDDSMDLIVRHRLFSRGELTDQSYKTKFQKRVGDALGLEEPQPAKSRRVERRQLMGRGYQVARTCPRPSRKPAKGRRAA